MNNLILVSVILTVIFAGMIILEIVLSKKKNKWLGLILPLVTVCISLVAVFATPAYVTGSERTVIEQSVTQSGDVIENIIATVPQVDLPGAGTMIFTGVYLFLLYNIPTAVLMIIYVACRAGRKNNAKLEKMNIQDLS